MRRTSFKRDSVIAAVAFLVLAAMPLIFPGKAFSDFMIRLSAFAIFTSS